MSEHTKGPWTVVNHPRRENWVTIQDASHRFVVKPDARNDASGETSDFGVWMTPENARLIAAAPDLLEALERLAQSVEKSAEYEDYCPHCDEYPGGDWDHEDDCPLVAARAAIAKARGTNN